jgi:small subunit ribosomal protein S17
VTSDAKKDERGQRPTVTGTVVSTKMKDTITVREDRMVRHPLYGKFVKRGTKYYAHDAGNTAREGDVVEIAHTRPISKLKTWRLLRIVRRGSGGIVHTDADAVAPAAVQAPDAAAGRQET